MSDMDDQDTGDAELEVKPETLEDLEVDQEGDDPKGGLARKTLDQEAYTC